MKGGELHGQQQKAQRTAGDGTLDFEECLDRTARYRTIQGYKYGTAATPCIVWTEGDGTSAKDHNIDYIEIKERYNATSSDDKNTVEAVARVVKGSTYTTAGGATVTFASDGTVTASKYSGTLVGYRYMTLTEVSEQVASTQSALADADALNLDQDYRLTLLELGVTDDETTA